LKKNPADGKRSLRGCRCCWSWRRECTRTQTLNTAQQWYISTPKYCFFFTNIM